MERITTKDVDQALANAVRAAQACGLDTAGWTVQKGSATYGRAWRLYRLEAGTGALHETCVPNYLGWSAREAYNTLHTLANAWHAVAGAKS